MKCFGTKVNRISETHGITREVELCILLSTDLGLNPQKEISCKPRPGNFMVLVIT